MLFKLGLVIRSLKAASMLALIVSGLMSTDLSMKFDSSEVEAESLFYLTEKLKSFLDPST